MYKSFRKVNNVFWMFSSRIPHWIIDMHEIDCNKRFRPCNQERVAIFDVENLLSMALFDTDFVGNI